MRKKKEHDVDRMVAALEDIEQILSAYWDDPPIGKDGCVAASQTLVRHALEGVRSHQERV